MTTFPAGTVAYSYIRMSTKRQLRGDSLSRQTEASDAFIHKHGLILDTTIHDIGQSAWTGANLKKGGLGKFLALVEEGAIAPGSVLLVEAMDRLSRQTVLNALEPFLAILRAGITIVTLKDETIHSAEGIKDDWTKLIMSLSEMATANKESERKSGLVRKAAETKRQNGLKGIGKYSQNVPGWIGQDKQADGSIEYVLNEHAPTIREIFEMAADNVGQMGIAKILNRRDTPTLRRSSTGWHQTTVRNILTNRAVFGVLEPRKLVAGKMQRYGDDIPDYYPPVIDEALFYDVQRTLIKRGPRVRRGNTFTNLFQGLSTCAQCFGPMSVSYGGAKPYTTYLRCYNYSRRKGCTTGTKTWVYDRLELVVLDAIAEFGLSDFANRQDRKPELLAVEKQVRDLEAQVTTAKAGQQSLMDQLLTASEKLVPIYQERIEKLIDEETAAQFDLETAKRRKITLDGERNDTSNADAMIKADRLLWPDMDDEHLSRSRSKVHAAIKQVYEMMTFDTENEMIMLWAANGLKAYRFKDYKLLDTFDAIRVGAGDGGMRAHHFLNGFNGHDDEKMALADRKELIRRHILATNKVRAGATNPRLNDPDVIAIKAKRQAEKEAAQRKKAQHD